MKDRGGGCREAGGTAEAGKEDSKMVPAAPKSQDSEMQVEKATGKMSAEEMFAKIMGKQQEADHCYQQVNELTRGLWGDEASVHVFNADLLQGHTALFPTTPNLGLAGRGGGGWNCQDQTSRM